MHNAVAIFRKDVRAAWPQLALWLLVVVILTVTVVGEPLKIHSLTLLLDLVCGWLILTVMHQERLPGDTQYWLARPISRRDIFAAKLLFIAAFVHLPLLFSGVLQVSALGFSPLEYASTLLLSQVALAAIPVFIFPLAAITRNLSQAVIAMLCVLLPMRGIDLLFVSPHFPRFTMPWWMGEIGSKLLAATLSAVVVCVMYTTRRTILARSLFGAGAVVVILTAFSFSESRGTLDTHITPDIPAAVRGPLNRLEIPIRFSGLPQSGEVVVDKLSRRGEVFPFPRDLNPQITLYGEARGILTLNVSPVRAGLLDATLEFTIFERLSEIPIPETDPVLVPGIGPCMPDRMMIFCSSPRPTRLLGLIPSSGRVRWIVPPDARSISGLLFTPWQTYFGFPNDMPRAATPRMFTARLLAHVRGHIDFRGLAQ